MSLRSCGLRESTSTQKPAAHGCGRVLGETIQFDKNTTTHWTSQSRLDFLFHRRCITGQCTAASVARMSEAIYGVSAFPHVAALMGLRASTSTQKPAAHFCGRVLGEAIQFDKNITTHWTSQSRLDCVFHRRCITGECTVASVARMSEATSGFRRSRMLLRSCAGCGCLRQRKTPPSNIERIAPSPARFDSHRAAVPGGAAWLVRMMDEA
jgi:hypothetical protein